ncbi:hypothetical protein SDC9_192601 [bioreactor metagenome]|uniref:Uncharacterized protein n=1 Tax=bioreactor metagenome TaxID=1076179 RepID=A0A645I9P5_9ZZZZ
MDGVTFNIQFGFFTIVDGKLSDCIDILLRVCENSDFRRRTKLNCITEICHNFFVTDFLKFEFVCFGNQCRRLEIDHFEPPNIIINSTAYTLLYILSQYFSIKF